MSINTREIRECCQALDSERKILTDLIEERATLDMTGHQTKISVTFNYGKQSRGREMIALGAKLAFNGMIERHRQKIDVLEKRLANLSVKGGAK